MTYRAKQVYEASEIALKYDRERFKSLVGRFVNWRELNLISKAAKVAHIKSSAKVLDIPCGTGRLSLFLAGKGFNVTGIDISPAMLQQAKEKLRHTDVKKKVDLFVGDAESIALPDNSFDVVVSLRFFGHLPPEARKRVLREFARLSNNFLIVAYYCRNSLQGFLRRRRRRQGGINWYSVDGKEICEELEETNLELIRKLFLTLPGLSETVIVVAKKC